MALNGLNCAYVPLRNYSLTVLSSRLLCHISQITFWEWRKCWQLPQYRLIKEMSTEETTRYFMHWKFSSLL